MTARPNRRDRFSRRAFLQAGVGAAYALGTLPYRGLADEAAEEPVAFFVISDTHYLADRERPTRLTAGSAAVNERLVETLNELPGSAIPQEIGGGRVSRPRGVLHLGDIVDTGDKLGNIHAQMTDTEWKHYVEQVGLTGKEGKLRWPVYEVHGNHDSPRQRNAPIEGIIRRNADRSGLANVSDNGVHYSWDWGSVHFVALGVVVGPNADGLPIGRYDAYESLPFLIADLERHVGGSGRPVVLLHHVDLHRYARPCDTSRRGGSRAMCCNGMARIAWCNSGCTRSAGITLDEWGPCDVAAYHRAVTPYNVAAVFHGHLHSRRTEHWDGARLDATDGIPVFGSNNSGAGGTDRSLLYCCIEHEHLVVREYRSRGAPGWHKEQSQLQWSPEVWRVRLGD